MTTQITTGDDATLSVSLTYNGVPLEIETGSVVKAALTTLDRQKLTSDITCSSSTYGADWANGLVVAEFSAVETGAIDIPDLGRVLVEVQVDYAGKKNTFWSTGTVRIYEGTIA